MQAGAQFAFDRQRIIGLFVGWLTVDQEQGLSLVRQAAVRSVETFGSPRRLIEQRPIANHCRVTRMTTGSVCEVQVAESRER